MQAGDGAPSYCLPGPSLGELAVDVVTAPQGVSSISGDWFFDARRSIRVAGWRGDGADAIAGWVRPANAHDAISGLGAFRMSGTRNDVAVHGQGLFAEVLWHVARTTATVERSRNLLARTTTAERGEELTRLGTRQRDARMGHQAGEIMSIGELALLGEATALLALLQDETRANDLVAQAASLACASLQILLDCVMRSNDGPVRDPVPPLLGS